MCLENSDLHRWTNLAHVFMSLLVFRVVHCTLLHELLALPLALSKGSYFTVAFEIGGSLVVYRVQGSGMSANQNQDSHSLVRQSLRVFGSS